MAADRPAPAFTFASLDAADAERHPHVLQAIFERELDGVIVRGAIPRAALDAAIARIDAGEVPRRTRFGGAGVGAYTVGHAIVGAEPDLVEYFDDGEAQRERVRRLFAGHVDFEGAITATLGALSGGLPVAGAFGPGGRQCPFATIRVIPEGGEIGVHVDNAYLHMPAAAHLRALVDPTDQLSYFVPLSVPAAGGELVVYDLEWAAARLFMPAAEGAAGNVWFEGSEVVQAIEGFGSTAFAPSPGDLLVFDGGRYFHRVSKVQGPMPRRTIGGFLGFSPGHDRIYVWS